MYLLIYVAVFASAILFGSVLIITIMNDTFKMNIFSKSFVDCPSYISYCYLPEFIAIISFIFIFISFIMIFIFMKQKYV